MSIKDRDGLRAVVESLVATANEMKANNDGGEEFGVILTNTVLRAALTISDHVRRAAMSKELMKRSTGQNLAAISLGVATLHKDDTAQSLIARADACLYAAKRNGRNRVICETDPECASSESKVA